MRPSGPASRCVWPQEHLLHDSKRWTRITGLVRITNCFNVRRQSVKCQQSFQSLYLSSTWGWPTFTPADRRPPHASGAFDLLIFSKNLKTSFCQSAQSQIILLPPPIQLPSSTLSLSCALTHSNKPHHLPSTDRRAYQCRFSYAEIKQTHLAQFSSRTDSHRYCAHLNPLLLIGYCFETIQRVSSFEMKNIHDELKGRAGDCLFSLS